jgi:hypothetical protein
MGDDGLWTGISLGTDETRVSISRVLFEGPDGAIGQSMIDEGTVEEDSVTVTQAPLGEGGGALGAAIKVKSDYNGTLNQRVCHKSVERGGGWRDRTRVGSAGFGGQQESWWKGLETLRLGMKIK